jgi:hypothetical protein
MNVPFSTRQVEYILAWKDGTAWPDEQRVLNKLRRSITDNTPLQLSVVQAGIVRTWVEEKTSGHYGGGQVFNLEESSILHILDTAITRYHEFGNDEAATS